MSRTYEVKPCQTDQAPPLFAVALVCADDGVEHLVPDDTATVAIVFGGQARAVCGHQVTPAVALRQARAVCESCPEVAPVLGLTLP